MPTLPAAPTTWASRLPARHWRKLTMAVTAVVASATVIGGIALGVAAPATSPVAPVAAAAVQPDAGVQPDDAGHHGDVAQPGDRRDDHRHGR